MSSDDPQDPPDDATDAVVAFINARTRVASRQVLRERTDALFTPRADTVFARLIEQYEPEPAAAQHISELRVRVQEARERGIDAAFASSITPAYAASLEQELAQSPLDGSRRLEVASALLTLAEDTEDAPRIATFRHELGRSLARAALRSPPERSLAWLEAAIGLIDRDRAPVEWAKAQHNLGETLRQRIDEAGAVERAIHCFEQALQVFNARTAPVDCGLAENSLGGAYLNRTEGTRAQNIELAVVHLEAALALRPRESQPVFWCKTSLNLGIAYSLRASGDSAANASTAMRHLEAALGPEAAKLDSLPVTQGRWMLADLLAKRAASPGHGADAARAIEVAEQALAEAGPTASAHDIASLHALVAELLDHGAPDSEPDAERAIECYHMALEAGRGNPRWALGEALAEQSLGQLYEFRKASNRAADLAAAVEHYEAAAALHDAAGVAQAAAACRYFAGRSWFKRRDVPIEAAAEQAARRVRAALAQYPDAASAPLRVAMHAELGDALCTLAAGDRGERIEDAIGHYEAALVELSPQRARDDWMRVHSALGVAMLERPGGERADNLERAIDHQREVLAVCSRDSDPRDWALAQHNLGNTYAERTRGSKRDNLEQAIACFDAALTVWTRKDTPDEWAMSLNSSAGALVARISGDRADNIERGLARYHQALEAYTREAYPADWAMTLHNLALGYLQRIEGDRDVNTDRAIDALTRSLEVRTRDAQPYFWAMTQGNLGTAWSKRQVGEAAENARRAVEHFRLAQQVYTREAYPNDWAGVELSLGASRLLTDARAQIDSLERALQVYTPEQHPERWALSELALGQAWAALDPGDPNAAAASVRHFEAALQGLSPLGQPLHRRAALAGLADQCERRAQWRRALEWYDEAIALGEQAFADSHTTDGLLAATGAMVALYRQSADCLFELGRHADSLLRLEAGRTRLLAMDPARDDADLAPLPDELRTRLRDARREVRLLAAETRESDEDAPRQEPVDWSRLDKTFPDAPRQVIDGTALYSLSLREARAALAGSGLQIDVAARLRDARAELAAAEAAAYAACPGMRPLPIDEAQLLALIPPGGALITFMLGSNPVAWVLPYGADRVDLSHVVRLTDDTVERLQQHVGGSNDEPGWIELLGRTRRAGEAELDDDQRHERMESLTGELWDLLMGPVQARLEALGLGAETPVLLIQQGALALLPLHAAWRLLDGHPRWFVDDHDVTCAPSFVAARTSRARAAEPARQRRLLLAIADPSGDLPHALEECAAVAGRFGAAASRALIGPQATEAAVTAAIGGRSHVHFATHGRYHGYDLMRSHLVLAADTKLTLARVVSPLIDLSHALLVVLSACDSGLSEASRTPDEFLGMPGGFLEGGAAGVLSALWSINDASSALLLNVFYRLHLDGGMPVAGALRGAQRWLRDATVEELGLAQRWEAAYRASLPDAPDAGAYGMMRWCRANPQARPYASPYFWAAFVFNGG